MRSLLRSVLEHVVPIVMRGAQALDSWIESDHGLGHRLAGWIGIEAAVDWGGSIQEIGKPAWVGPGAGGGETTIAQVESKAANRVDGRLHQHDGRPRVSGDSKVAQVLARTRS